MTTARHIVVVGASQAGTACAAALREYGFDGPIMMIGDEPHPPYTRPPLSKSVLTGEHPEENVFLSCDDVNLLTSVAAVGLDRGRRLVRLSGGDSVRYDGLVVATGARARGLAPRGQSGEVMLRNLDDGRRLRRYLNAADSVAIAGGGFLGMEIASSATTLGKSVTIADIVTPLAGRLGAILSDLVLTAAVEHGVKVLVSPGGIRVGFDSETPNRLLTVDGAVLAEADFAVTAVGDVPNVGWLEDTGLPINGGLIVDEASRAAEDIVAAGDVVAGGESGSAPTRTPHWWNALTQAKVAAASLLGREPDQGAALTPPYFWTEAFGLHIRMAGHLPPKGEPTVIEGSLAHRRALLAWPSSATDYGTAASVNIPISVKKLTRLAQHAPTPEGTPR